MSDQGYVCTLDAASVKKARDELGEIPEDRLAAVQALREWIEQQKHISFHKTEPRYLLQFLRSVKFSQLRAREMVENHLRLKIQAPQWFANVDVRDRQVMALLNAGYVIPLPKRHPDGSIIVLYQIGRMKPDLIHMDGVCKAATLLLHYIIRDEMTQVNGVTFLMDCTNVSNKTGLKFLKPEFAKWNKLWQKNMPGRFKAFNYYNVGMLMEIGMTFFRACLSKKYFERLHFFDTAEALYSNIPKECLPVEYLPDEYDGPNGGDIPTLLDNFKQEVRSETFRQDLLYYTGKGFSLDESQKSSEPPTQHFRKLTVD